MATFLVEHAWLPEVALLLLVVVGPLVGAWLSRRPRIAAYVAALSVLPVLALTLVPDDREAFETCEMAWTISLRGPEPVANIVLFVVPALTAVAACRRPVVVLLALLTCSGLIEVVQAAVPALGRSCSTGDWIANSLGAFIGAALGLVSVRLLEERRRA